MNVIEVKCLQCGKEFNKKEYEYKKHPNSFCSRSCSAKYNNSKHPKRKYTHFCIDCGSKISSGSNRCYDCYIKNIKNNKRVKSRKPIIRNPNTICSFCKKPIYRSPSSIKKSKYTFCSRECQGHLKEKPKICIVCGKEFSNRSWASKNKERLICSRACSNKNRRGIKYTREQSRSNALKIQNIKNDLYLKRGSKCEACGYDKKECLDIHHIIEKSNNGTNDEDNLLILCPNCHREVHREVNGLGLILQKSKLEGLLLA